MTELEWGFLVVCLFCAAMVGGTALIAFFGLRAMGPDEEEVAAEKRATVTEETT